MVECIYTILYFWGFVKSKKVSRVSEVAIVSQECQYSVVADAGVARRFYNSHKTHGKGVISNDCVIYIAL